MRTIGVTTIIVSLAAIFLIGCTTKPSLSVGERALRSRIEKESEGRLKLGKFEKTGDEMGFEGYCWSLVGDIEVVEDCVWLFDRPSGTVHIDFRTIRAGEQAEGIAVKRGQRYSLFAAVYLNKEERGWVASHVAIREFPREIR